MAKALEHPPMLGSPHTLRHTFGTRLAQRGARVGVIQKLMGHSTIAVTERYMQVNDEETAVAVGLLEPQAKEAAG